MFRYAYRNFGTHESAVVTHSVNVNPSGAIRAAVSLYHLLFFYSIMSEASKLSLLPRLSCIPTCLVFLSLLKIQTIQPRWYEIRGVTSSSPYVYQQSTFSPDSISRWMGTMAMDKVGNIALGYSISSPTTFPGMALTGRLVNDPLNTMTQVCSVMPT